MPLTLRVKPELCALMLEGESEVRLGAGLLTIPPQAGRSAAMAIRTQIA